MIVESLGITGSGKSSLIPLLTQLMGVEGRLAMSATQAIHYYMGKTIAGRLVGSLLPSTLRGPMLWRIYSYFYSPLYALIFSLENPGLSYYVVKSQLPRHVPWSHRLLIIRQYFKMAARSKFFKHFIQPRQIIFLDEGFVHRSTHLFVSESEILNPEHVKAYLRLIPPQDLVIWLRAPVDLCLSRVSTRGIQTRLIGLSVSARRQFILNAEEVCEIVAEYVKSVGWPIIVTDNTGSQEECAFHLSRSIQQYTE